MDTTIIATALYTIGVDLQSLGTVTWIALAYTLSYLGCAVAFARIADIVGRRDAYIGASVIFLAFSLGCGFAKTLNQLIACRVLQGIGGSGLYSLTFVILPEISPHRMSQWIAAVAGIVVACSGVLGPVLGGIITHYTTWRWIFWLKYKNHYATMAQTLTMKVRLLGLCPLFYSSLHGHRHTNCDRLKSDVSESSS